METNNPEFLVQMMAATTAEKRIQQSLTETGDYQASRLSAIEQLTQLRTECNNKVRSEAKHLLANRGTRHGLIKIFSSGSKKISSRIVSPLLSLMMGNSSTDLYSAADYLPLRMIMSHSKAVGIAMELKEICEPKGFEGYVSSLTMLKFLKGEEETLAKAKTAVLKDLMMNYMGMVGLAGAAASLFSAIMGDGSDNGGEEDDEDEVPVIRGRQDLVDDEEPDPDDDEVFPSHSPSPFAISGPRTKRF